MEFAFLCVGSLNFFSEFLKDDENVQMVFLCWCKIRFFCLLEIQLKPVDLPGSLLRPLFKSQIIFQVQIPDNPLECSGSISVLRSLRWSTGSVAAWTQTLPCYLSGPARQLGSGAQPAVPRAEAATSAQILGLQSATRSVLTANSSRPARDGMGRPAADKYNSMISVLLFGFSTNDATATRRVFHAFDQNCRRQNSAPRSD